MTNILKSLGFIIRYYDFPYISDELKREIIDKNQILITVIFPGLYSDMLLSSNPIKYKYELYDCVLINPKYRYKYIDLIANCRSIWSYRKFFGIEHSEAYPYLKKSSLSTKQKLLALKGYCFCKFRREIIGREYEQRLIRFTKYFFGNSQKKIITDESESKSQFEGMELNFILKFKSHFAPGRYSDEFWFEFTEKNINTVPWPGDDNCISAAELEKYPNALDLIRTQAALFKLYRDQ